MFGDNNNIVILCEGLYCLLVKVVLGIYWCLGYEVVYIDKIDVYLVLIFFV